MKAVVLRELGDPDVLQLQDVPDPHPGPGEVVVRLRAAALNRRDVWIRKGRYAGIKLPVILGSDGAGEVLETGAGVDSGTHRPRGRHRPRVQLGRRRAGPGTRLSDPGSAARRHLCRTGHRSGRQPARRSRRTCRSRRPPRCRSPRSPHSGRWSPARGLVRASRWSSPASVAGLRPARCSSRHASVLAST